jgi:hypothetical protein
MVSGANASDTNGRLSDRRQLIAVLYADMVGYSPLIGLDDQGTLQRLRALRTDLIDQQSRSTAAGSFSRVATPCSSSSTASTGRCAVP